VIPMSYVHRLMWTALAKNLLEKLLYWLEFASIFWAELQR